MTTLHLLCGKIASGKSTRAHALADEQAAILISEDRWLAALYPDEIRSVSDYVQRARRIRGVLEPLVISLLKADNNVVLDFPANTVADRAWLRGLADQAGVQHRLHFLDVDDQTCLERLRARNAQGGHDFAATDREFEVITSYFRAPEDDEGLVVVTD
ncbi:cell division protein ZipA [Pseudomonas floridensis]|uniref:Cell division protein ZipA n=1 Tax=Pseudomonas floridensis TaxID=1958950 RepID=A0A1X0MZF3_9PSED|nr:ATP-binding protein [Pseudomonas floridensis]ORC55728.1 cell division protein ZipA [Pseudomonas floridensis]